MENNTKKRREILKERYFEASGFFNKDIKKIRRRQNLAGSIFVFTPAIIILVYVFLAFGIAFSLTFFAGKNVTAFNLSNLKFVGFKNWSILFNEDFSTLLLAMRNTFIFASITTVFNIFGAIIISSILNSKNVKRKNIFMTLYFLPQVTSGIAIAIIFVRLTGENSIFGFNIISNPSDALWVMIISSVWSGVSGGLITFNTAFSGVDRSQYEYASIDGANAFNKFWRITIPSLGPIIAYSVIMSIIGGMGIFDQAFIMNVTGADIDSVLTWSLLGFLRIVALAGDSSAKYAKNIGLGMSTLTLLSVCIFTLTRIANIIVPLDRRSS